MTQFDMSTIVKKLQDISRKRRFLISEVEKTEKITRLILLSQATNAESDGINTYVLLIYLYFIMYGTWSCVTFYDYYIISISK